MHPLFDAPPIGVALFHGRSGGFPLLLCSYVLLDTDGNPAADLTRVAVARITVLNGQHFALRDPQEIRRFLAAVGRTTDEVAR
jgi:hypothetical protein